VRSLLSLVAPAAAALLLGGAAQAATRCLEGDATLADRRALDAVQEATEAACPCASFTGGANRNRHAYQRCARAVLAKRVGAGLLRRQCRRTATKRNRGATCGTSRIACGHVPAAARRPATCRLERAGACRDRRRTAEDACAEATHCDDVVAWGGGTCADTRRAGPYTPGFRTLVLAKPSVVDPAEDRVLEVAVWYPTATDPGLVDPATGGVLDAPVATDGPFPVLVFSHGSCGYPMQSLFLTPVIASYGFIVVAPPHPGNTLAEFPLCGTPTAQVASYAERPADVRFALDTMLAAGADATSPFFGAVDATRLGMSGHSFGGLTTYLVVQNDPRYRVAMPMAPAVLGDPVLPVPSLTMLGEIDSVVSLPPIRTAYERAAAPKYLIGIEHAGHYAFSDLCFPSADCMPPATLTQDEAHRLVLRWVIPFLGRYLAGDERWVPLLVGPPAPGIELQSAG
jgi:dienelactone hydrolase